METGNDIVVIGAGLAGCEAAWQAARLGSQVTLLEMKPHQFSPAHRSPDLAELVCSNSLRSTSITNASGLLKEELRRLGSLIIEHADRHNVPAGSALAVDRAAFSAAITKALEENPRVTVVREEMRRVPEDKVTIVATGPLTSASFSSHLGELIGERFLYFHDAISPIIEADSINRGKTFRASRYNRGSADYINCPLAQQAYYSLVRQLCSAEKVAIRDFETLIPFEGCMPIEVMAERGPETLAHGPMKPVGLIDPETGSQPYAVVQLRQENSAATLYNMVGFQTRLTWPNQKKIFQQIPGLEKAEFARYGSLHRNTFIDSPRLLFKTLQLKKMPRLFFAGQITGVEGYMESAAMGLYAGIQAHRYACGHNPVIPPETTVTGALVRFITNPCPTGFQPMNANFGIMQPLQEKVPRSQKKEKMAQRALNDIQQWRTGF